MWLGQRISARRRLLRAAAKLALRVKGQQVVLTSLGDVLDEQQWTRKLCTLIENYTNMGAWEKVWVTRQE